MTRLQAIEKHKYQPIHIHHKMTKQAFGTVGQKAFPAGKTIAESMKRLF